MDTLKSIFVIILSSMLILQGCSTYSAFTGDSLRKVPPPDNTILVSTFDGYEYEIEPYHFVEVREPSPCIYGAGERAEKGSTHFKYFCGTARPLAMTAEDVIRPNGWAGTERRSCLVAVCDDSSTVRILKSDCVIVDSLQGPGLWCIGVKKSISFSNAFSGRIPFEQIQSVDVKKVSELKTAAVVLATAGTLTAIILLATFRIDFKMSSSHF